jgi:hypothetical protein
MKPPATAYLHTCGRLGGYPNLEARLTGGGVEYKAAR